MAKRRSKTSTKRRSKKSTRPRGAKQPRRGKKGAKAVARAKRARRELIVLVEVAGETRELARIPSADTTVREATISPDGQRVAWVVDMASEASELWVARTDGSEEPSRLDLEVEVPDGLEWTDDGAISYRELDGDRRRRFVVEVASGRPRLPAEARDARPARRRPPAAGGSFSWPSLHGPKPLDRRSPVAVGPAVKLAWSRRATKRAWDGTCVGGGGRVYVNDRATDLDALELATGERVWTAKDCREKERLTVFLAGSLWTSRGETVVKIDPRDGSFRELAPAGLERPSGELLRLQTDGDHLVTPWGSLLSTDDLSVAGQLPLANPILAGRDLLGVPRARPKTLVCLDRAASKERWSAGLGVSSDLTWRIVSIGDDALLLLEPKGPGARALDRATGRELWRVDADEDDLRSAIQAAGKVIIPRRGERALVALDARTGERVWSRKAGLYYYVPRGAQLVVTGDTVWSVEPANLAQWGQERHLVGTDARSGEVVTREPLGSGALQDASIKAVIDDALLVLVDYAKLLCWR